MFLKVHLCDSFALVPIVRTGISLLTKETFTQVSLSVPHKPMAGRAAFLLQCHSLYSLFGLFLSTLCLAGGQSGLE